MIGFIQNSCTLPMGKSEYKKVAEDKKIAKSDIIKDKNPLLMVFAPNKGFSNDKFFQLLEGLLILSSHIVVITDTEMPDADTHLTGKISWVNTESGRNEEIVDKYLTAADMVLVFDDHMDRLDKIMSKGGVVIGHEKSPFLENYKPNEETGNSFTFGSKNPWDIFRAIVRAHETYMFPYDWQNIVRRIIKNSS
jgi:hypothetical protein